MAKSETGDPLADRKSKMSSKSYDKAVKSEASLRTSQRLNKKASEINENRSTGSKIATRLLTGKTGNTTYSTLRASGYSKKGATAITALVNHNVAMNLADEKYRNSSEGKRYSGRVASSYYN